MDYKEKYKEALERARKLHENSNGMILKKWLWNIFPELKESEDEKIRKALISVLKSDFEKDTTIYDISVGDIIEWLEKQSEQKSDDKIEPTDYNSIDPHFAKSIDKVEPKFHEGEWVVDNECGKVNQITSVTNQGYDFANGDYMSYESAHKELRLWDISDAKDGDVLVHNSILFIFTGIEDGIVKGICTELSDTILNFGMPEYDNDYCPATKEQRDTLMKAMADAGYTFDFEKKELKKIEFNADDIIEESYQQQADDLIDMVTEKSAEWSEEDEEMVDKIIDYIKPMPIFFESTKGKSGKEYTKEFVKNATKWLKSIKERYTWLPSDEQMKALAEALSLAKNCGEESAFDLRTLYEQLKKL